LHTHGGVLLGNNKGVVVLIVHVCRTYGKEVPVVFMTWCR